MAHSKTLVEERFSFCLYLNWSLDFCPVTDFWLRCTIWLDLRYKTSIDWEGWTSLLIEGELDGWSKMCSIKMNQNAARLSSQKGFLVPR